MMHTPIKDNMWKGQRCFIIGGGPSLKGFDWSLLEGELTIGCNLAFEAFDPCMVVAVDKRFYQWILWGEYEEKHPGLRQRFLDLNVGKYLLYPPESLSNFYTGIDIIPRNNSGTLSTTLAEGVMMGSNTGFAAINLALCLGADPIYLLGFDMSGDGAGKQAHFHAGHPTIQADTCYPKFIETFDRFAPELSKHARIVNLNPESKLEHFEKVAWADAGIEPKRRPKVVCYYAGEGYKREAFEMERTARLFGLKPFVQERDSAGGWKENTYQKVDFLISCMERFEDPLVWIDADARFRKYPERLDVFAEHDDLDMALALVNWSQFRPDTTRVELCSGTLGVRRTPNGHRVLEGWRDEIAATQPKGDQNALESFLKKPEAPNITYTELPPSYLYILPQMQGAKFEPVIEQTQASRRYRGQLAIQAPPTPKLSDLPHHRRERPMHVLITGLPRSGTSLFANMFAYAYPGFKHITGECPATDIIGAKGDTLSKRPFDALLLKEIKQAADAAGKDLVVFFMLRDFRDVVTAVRWDKYMVSFEHCELKQGGHGPGIFRLTQCLEEAMCNEGLFCATMQYELLVQNTEAIQNFVAAVIKEDSPYSFRQHFEAKDPFMPRSEQKNKLPVDGKWIGRWRNPKHRQRVVEQFSTEEARDLLIRYGFVRNDEWYAQLVAGSEVIPLELAKQFRLSVDASQLIQIGRPLDNQCKVAMQ